MNKLNRCAWSLGCREWYPATTEYFHSNGKVSLTGTCRRCRSDRHVYHKFGLTPNDVRQMLEDQDNCCAVCHVEATTVHKIGITNMLIDHVPDSNPKRVRGLVCSRCNIIILRAVDFLVSNEIPIQRVLLYLEQGQTFTKGTALPSNTNRIRIMNGREEGLCTWQYGCHNWYPNTLEYFHKKTNSRLKSVCISCEQNLWVHQKYGITPSDMNDLMERYNNCCGICYNEFKSNSNNKKAGTRVVDHVPNTEPKVVRGLLCWECNRIIASAFDLMKDKDINIDSVLRYVNMI